MKKILVTGGAGFIGSHIVEYYHQRTEIVVLDNKPSDNLKGLRHTFINDSVLSRKMVREAMEGVDTVFHCAAMVSVFDSTIEPHKCIEQNANGTLLVLEEAQRAGVSKFVYSSSAAVYGNTTYRNYESFSPRPQSPYAITKLDGEYYALVYSDRMKVVCLRYFNVFGPRQSGYSAVIPSFIYKALRNEPIVINGDGNQTRDFVHVRNVVEANRIACKAQSRGIINVGCGSGTTINKLAADIIALTKSSSTIVYDGPRPQDVYFSVASIDVLRGLGYQPLVSYEAGLAETVSYFKDLYTNSEAGKTDPQ